MVNKVKMDGENRKTIVQNYDHEKFNIRHNFLEIDEPCYFIEDRIFNGWKLLNDILYGIMSFMLLSTVMSEIGLK